MIVDLQSVIDIRCAVKFFGNERHPFADGLFSPVVPEGFGDDLIVFRLAFEDGAKGERTTPGLGPGD